MTQTAIHSGSSRRSSARSSTDSYSMLFRAPVIDRIALITRGVPAAEAKQLLDIPALARNITLKALDLPVATFNKRVKANAKLTPAESERVVGFARLVGQLETLLDEAGSPSEFDALGWLALWLVTPLPALGNARPIDFMNTIAGQNLVSQQLAQIASGAYA